MPESDFSNLWIYLSASPLLGLSMTVLIYSLAYRLYLYANANPLLNPVLTTITLLIIFLLASDISYAAYFEGGQFIHFLLGPATVALAIPLYQQLDKLKKAWLPILISVISGVLIAAFSSMSIIRLMGGSMETQLSLAPKSVTTPVAMGISELIGGIPSLTAILVVMTGIFGALIGTKLFSLMQITDDSIKGIAMGVTAHGIGTARAFQVSPEMGAFSGLAMALSAFASAFILPWLLNLAGMLN